MRRLYGILWLLIIGGSVGSGRAVLAQEVPSVPLNPPYEVATVSLSVPPTPQFFRLEADFSEAGITALRIPIDPAWVAATRRDVRLEPGQAMREPAETVVLPLTGGVEELRQFLEQALNQVREAVTPSR